MKKIAALGMSAVMVAGMMAGCGSSSDSSSSDSIFKKRCYNDAE